MIFCKFKKVEESMKMLMRHRRYKKIKYNFQRQVKQCLRFKHTHTHTHTHTLNGNNRKIGSSEEKKISKLENIAMGTI